VCCEMVMRWGEGWQRGLRRVVHATAAEHPELLDEECHWWQFRNLGCRRHLFSLEGGCDREEHASGQGAPPFARSPAGRPRYWS